METINEVLKVLFLETKPEDLIARLVDGSVGYSDFDSFVDKDIFSRQIINNSHAKSIDQAEIVYNVLHDEWSLPDMGDYDLKYCNTYNIFNVLLHFSKNRIRISHLVPVCRYERLFSWHEITRDLGEDLFVTSFLASYDLKNCFLRSRFDWKFYLDNDAQGLSEIFSREMFDIHVHLNGASMNFDLNWLSLMNVLTGHEHVFSNFDAKKVFPTVSYRLDMNNRCLYVKVLCAAAIRLYLFLYDINEEWSIDIMNKIHIKDVLRSRSIEEIIPFVSDLQSYIDVMGFHVSRKYIDEYNHIKYIPDYAIVGAEQSCLSVLSGERRFMYNNFSKIYSGEYNSDRKAALFYIYLLIKEEFRKEMVQMNNTLGFANFSDYQERKCSFIGQNSVYEKLLPQLSVGTFMNGMDKRYMELRIAPKQTTKKDIRSIEWYDRCITDGVYTENKHIDTKNYYYIFHFIKLKECVSSSYDVDCFEYSLQPRHASLRKDVETQAKAIRELKRSGHDASRRLVGIDAANSEFFCRPEVFAHAYRYLSLPMTESGLDDNVCLGMTYHVGEDFYDIVDGLRAVDEVLKFLRFGNGARLGHALVLGLDVEPYYRYHSFKINATKQVILDNVTWLYVQGERLGCSTTLLAYLKELYCIYFHYIFFGSNKLVDIFSYYQSWLLRGDSPYRYQQADDDTDLRLYEFMDEWNRVALNHGAEIDDARNNPEARHLYFLYEYNKNVRRRGSKSDVLKIKDEYKQVFMDVIYSVQQNLLSKIEHFHISIECNPSSNYNIFGLKRYDEHPIVKFNNHGLNTPHPIHAINVSINTDDPGLFSTSLEREYSLMALAMEKHEDKDNVNTPRQILDWLENIRKTTKEQIFHMNYHEYSDT